MKRSPEKKEGALHSAQTKDTRRALLAGSEWERGEGRGERGVGSGKWGGWRDEAGCWGGTQAPSPECGSRQRSAKWALDGGPKGHSHPERHCL